MTDDEIIAEIIRLLDSAKDTEEIMIGIRQVYCTKCGKKGKSSNCWCDYDSPLE